MLQQGRTQSAFLARILLGSKLPQQVAPICCASPVRRRDRIGDPTRRGGEPMGAARPPLADVDCDGRVRRGRLER